MNADSDKLPARRHLLRQITPAQWLGFVITLILALQQDWQPRDLAWSNWVASLLVGGAFLLLPLIVSIWHPHALGQLTGNQVAEEKQRAGWKKALGFLFIFLVFIGIHLLMHLAYGTVLHDMVPYYDAEKISGLDEVGIALKLISDTARQYWVYLLIFAASGTGEWILSMKSGRGDTEKIAWRVAARMHLLIFLLFLFLASGLGRDSKAFLILLVFVFCFPMDFGKQDRAQQDLA